MKSEILIIPKFFTTTTTAVLFLTLVLSQNVHKATGENILFYWGCSSYSHRIFAWPLMEKLTEKGHNVTFLSPYPSKTPNPNSKVIEFIPKGLAEAIGLRGINFIDIRFKEGTAGIDNLWDAYMEGGIQGCKAVFSNPEVLKWVDKSSFDLVVVDTLFNECGYALAYKFKAPHILYAPSTLWSWWADVFGHPFENYMDLQHHYQVNMTFMQSVKSTLNGLSWHFKRIFSILPKQEKFLRKALQIPDMPSLIELEQNSSLIFLNNHFTEEFTRSLPPLYVQVGGIHCTDERKPLPKDIQEFIDSSGKEGFILLSFGTYADLSTLPEFLQNIFLNVMGRIKMKFLVVHKEAERKKFPENVKAVKWIPQQDVLAHPKIRAFIAHGGLLGTQEALYFNVSQIVFPLFAEQDYNAVITDTRGTGIALEITKLTEEILEGAIKEILSNKRFKENTERLSKLYKDRPLKPLDTAVWWVEYVLRNRNDTSHLRPMGQNKTWYQRRQLDIWGFIFAVVLAILTFIGMIFYFLTKRLVGSLFKSLKVIMDQAPKVLIYQKKDE